jgi:hypothetical protein
MAVINQSVSTAITFSQPGSGDTEQLVYRRGLLQSVTFVQTSSSAIPVPINKSVSNSFTFSQSALEGRGYSKSASNALTFTSNVNKTFNVSASNAISFGQSVVQSRAYNVSAANALAFVDTLSKAGSIWNKSLSTPVTFNPATYQEHTIGLVYFYYPAASPSTSIGLKKPLHGNSQTLMSQIDVKHSRSGEQYSYSRNPKYETLILTFDNISETLFAQIITFIKASAGKPIKYKDHKSDTWIGIITTDPLDLKQFARNSCGDLYTVEITMEATKQ